MEVYLETCQLQKIIAICSSLRVWSYLKATRTCFERRCLDAFMIMKVRYWVFKTDNSVVCNAQDNTEKAKETGILTLSKNMRYMTVWQWRAPADERSKCATSCIKRTSISCKESALYTNPTINRHAFQEDKRAMKYRSRPSRTQKAHETVLVLLTLRGPTSRPALSSLWSCELRSHVKYTPESWRNE